MRAHVIVKSGPDVGRRFVLRVGQRFVIGRGQGISAQLSDELVSRRHGSLELDPEGALVFRDLDSRNRSFHNGDAIPPHEDRRLEHGDYVQLGKETVLRVELEGSPDLDLSTDFLPAEEFEVLGELGTGSCGRVVAAKQRLLDRVVAIKVLRTDRHSDRERLVREARVALRIRSPYVVEAYDVRLFGKHLCLIMELVNGPSLRDQLRGPALTIPQAIALAEDVANALVRVHDEGVVHRDVKPANILVHPDGYALLADFGLAKDPDTGGPGLTASNVGMGSLSYVSPEQAQGASAVDPRADIYSLGATLYHLIAQRPPVEGSNVAQLLKDIVEGSPPGLAALERECPPEVAAYVHAMLSKDPGQRPADAESVARDLRALRERHFPAFVPCVPGRRNQPHPSETQGGKSSSRLELRPPSG